MDEETTQGAPETSDNAMMAEGVDAPEPVAPEPPAMPEPEPLPEPPVVPDFEPTPPPPPAPGAVTPPPPPAPSQSPFGGEKNKMVAGILAILLGSLGIHKFYLGYTKEGVIMLAVTLVGSWILGLGPLVMSVIGIIEGIMYLTKTDAEFESIYVTGQKPWF